MYQHWIEMNLEVAGDRVIVEKTCDYLILNINKPLTLKKIAMAMATNRSKLADSFKKELGLGVFEYLREQRLLKAQQLLIGSTSSIQEIAFEVGYGGGANFSTAYKNRFDVSPSRERKIHCERRSSLAVSSDVLFRSRSSELADR